MDFESNNYYRSLRNVHDECEKHMHFHIMVTLKDGKTIDGMIEKVDNDNIDMLVGEDVMEGETENTTPTTDVTDTERQGGYHQGPRRRYRRYRHRKFPLSLLGGLSLITYPYYVQPPYPYYPYYPYYNY